MIPTSFKALRRAAILAAMVVAAPVAASPPSDAFVAENEAVMARMHEAMLIRPTGDVDRDFVALMIPHHQGGIDMAVAVLRYSRNPQIRRLAQEIIVEQQEEITALRLAVGDPLPPPHPAPTSLPLAASAGAETPHVHGSGSNR